MQPRPSICVMRLLQLASPALPVGAYSYSQGMERAVADGVIVDERSASAWIADTLHLVLASFELPCLTAMREAVGRDDIVALQALNTEFVASRETLELRAETLQMGRSLARLLAELLPDAKPQSMLGAIVEPGYPCAFACAAHGFGLTPDLTACAYLWSWLENQTIAAMKLVPLGQSAGQRMMLELAGAAAALADSPLPPERWSNFAPGLALSSSTHETQYSRLFRS